MKLLFLIPYFGEFPKLYFNLFLKSVTYNPDLSFIIFTDNLPTVILPKNMKLVKMTMSEFNTLASLKLGMEVKVSFGYKLCDLRPMYGRIFADFIEDFDFWGHCDIDLILGNVNKFLTTDILENFELISLRKEWISGSLALYKNNEVVNNLYKSSKDWQKVAQSVDHLRFDECGILKTEQKMAYQLLAKGANILDLDMEIESISYVAEAIKQQKIEVKVNIFQQTLIKESIMKNSILKYENGAIFMYKSSEARHPENMQFAHYHFITEKNNGIFQFPNWEIVPNVFYIDETGFYTEKEFLNRELIYNQRIGAAKIKYWTQTIPKKIWAKIINKFKK